ncbi:hypothetical protein FRB99_002638 [Tulasnella sp. 403]|nr:hypothetical protein FRB99_002638 [Tulasnella sp. 403]
MAALIRSLHVHFEDRERTGCPQSFIRDLMLVLHATAPTLRRLHLHVDLTSTDIKRVVTFHPPYNLGSAIASLNSLEAFFFSHSPRRRLHIPLPRHSPLRKLGLLYPNVQHSKFHKVMDEFPHLEELYLFSPFAFVRSPAGEVVDQLAQLLNPPSELKKLVIAVFSGEHEVWAVEDGHQETFGKLVTASIVERLPSDTLLVVQGDKCPETVWGELHQ